MSAGEPTLIDRACDDLRVASPRDGAAGPPPISLGALLAKAAASLSEPTPAQRELLAKLDQARRRIAEGRLRVAALGQFKRGKSTLLNALMGAALLPTGVTPVTAIPTFIAGGGAARLRIEREAPREPLEFEDGAEFADALSRYVSEKHNPENRERVRQVELTLPSDAFTDNVVLVDTPGVGSTFVHNTRAAEAALADCDVGIFVVSADPPITEVETRYLDEVRRAIPKIFFVLNKVDLLEDDERAAAGAFLAEVLAQRLGPGRPVRIFAVSAKRALAAKRRGDAAALEAAIPLVRRPPILGRGGIRSRLPPCAGTLAKARRCLMMAPPALSPVASSTQLRSSRKLVSNWPTRRT